MRYTGFSCVLIRRKLGVCDKKFHLVDLTRFFDFLSTSCHNLSCAIVLRDVSERKVGPPFR